MHEFKESTNTIKFARKKQENIIGVDGRNQEKLLWKEALS